MAKMAAAAPVEPPAPTHTEPQEPAPESSPMSVADFRQELDALLKDGPASAAAPSADITAETTSGSQTKADSVQATPSSSPRADEATALPTGSATAAATAPAEPAQASRRAAPQDETEPEPPAEPEPPTGQEDGEGPADGYLSDGDDVSPARAAKLSRPESTASRVARWGGRSLSIALLASVVLAAALAIATRFLPTPWLVIGGVVVVAVAVGITYGLFVTRPQVHRKTYAGLTAGAVIGIVLSMFAAIFLYRVYDLANIIQPDTRTAVTYAVIAMKSSQLGPGPYDDAADGSDSESGDPTDSPTPSTPSATHTPAPFDPQVLTGTDIGLIGTDTNHDQVATEFGETVTANLMDYLAASELAAALTAGEVIAGIVDWSVLNLYKEHTPDFYAAMEVLYTFEVYIEATPSTVDANATTGPFVLFISGIDTWGDLSQTGLSDVNMLVVVNPNTGKMLLVNTPRDYYVPLRGHPGLPDKLTHAGSYGIDTSVGTIEDLYGVQVDYWLRINFNSVMDIVDALNGIDVEVTDEFTCGWGYMDDHFTFYPGVQRLNGLQALCFARERKSLEGGDRDRGKHQQLIIQGIMDRLTSPSVLLTYGNVITALSPHLETSMPVDQITAFARLQLERRIDWKIDDFSVDGYDAYAPTYTYGSQELYVMKPIISSVDEAKRLIGLVLAGG
jgi:LCP family protein required for cell wall assembly